MRFIISKTSLDLIVCATLVCVSAHGMAQQRSGTTAVAKMPRFQSSRMLAQTEVGNARVLEKLATGSRATVSIAVGNFFGDPSRALATGYALGTGGVISVQRGSDALSRPDEFDRSAPFVSSANFIDVGMRPDFLVPGDVNGDGGQDLVVASRGGSSVEILLGDGHGNFAVQTPFAIKGTIAGIAPWQDGQARERIAVAVCANSCAVQIYSNTGALVASVPVSDKITLMTVAHLNNTAAEDIVVGGSSKLVVIDGQSAQTNTPRIDTLPVAGAVAVAAGSFVFDRRALPQLAVLTADGALHTMARTGVIAQPAAALKDARKLIGQHKMVRLQRIDPRSLSWMDAETLGNVTSISSGETPLLARTRVSGSGMDDLLVISGRQTSIVRHPVVRFPGGSDSPFAGMMRALSASVEPQPVSGTELAAAAPARISQDGRFGLVTAPRGAAHPEYTELTASHMIYVTTLVDAPVTSATISACEASTSLSSGQTCSLRSALAVADGDASANELNGQADTVMVPPGTYVLGNNGPEEIGNPNPDQWGNPQTHIEIYGPVNVIGVDGASSTFISAANLDKVFSENSGNSVPENSQNAPIDVYFSGLTLEDGTNPGTVNNGLTGEQDLLAGLIDGDTGGTGNLTFVNCNFTNGTNLVGPGGAVSITDDLLGGHYGLGTGEVSGGVFSGNVTDESGGAITFGAGFNFDVPMQVTGVTFVGNSANAGLNPSDGLRQGSGGAIHLEQQPDITVTNTISNSVFSGNSAQQYAGDTASSNPEASSNGGAIYAYTGLSITGNTFTNNSVDGVLEQSSTTAQDDGQGGAIYLVGFYDQSSIAGNIFSANTATIDGGAIYIDVDETAARAYATPASIQYNSFSGDMATASGRSGLAVGPYAGAGSTDQQEPVTASENFWGCNAPAIGNNGCDGAGAVSQAGFTLLPYAVLSASLNTTTPAYGQAVTLTGGITSDSAGNPLGGNLFAFGGLPATVAIVQNNVELDNLTTSLDGTTATVSATANAANGTGNATITVEGAIVSIPFESPNPITGTVTFGAASINAGAATTLTIMLSNPAQAAQTSVSFNDALPAGLLVASAPGLVNTCGGTVNATAGGGSLSLSGGSLAASATCSVTLAITSVIPGGYTDTVTNLTSIPSGPGSSVSANLIVNQITPALTVSAPATATQGTAATLIATFTESVGGAPAPSAEVNFYAGATLVGSAPLTGTSGTYTATYAATYLPAGAQTITAQYPGDSSYVAVSSSNSVATSVTANYIWIGNSTGTVSALSALGSPYLSSVEPTGGTGISIDSSGDVWSLSKSGNTLAEFTSTGLIINAGYMGGGLLSPSALIIDGSGRVWVTNSNNSVSVFTNAGLPLSPSTGYTSNGLTAPSGISIDSSGNVWISNSSGNSVTEMLGAATPTLMPLAAGVATNKVATEP